MIARRLSRQIGRHAAASTTISLGAEPLRQPSHRAGDAWARARRRAGLGEDAVDPQDSGLPVEDRLDAADDPVAAQDREDVVAVLALRLRDVHLEPVEEVPERLGAVAVVDEPVERREERDARAHAPVLGLGVQRRGGLARASRRARGNASRRAAAALRRAARSPSPGTSARRGPRAAGLPAGRRPRSGRGGAAAPASTSGGPGCPTRRSAPRPARRGARAPARGSGPRSLELAEHVPPEPRLLLQELLRPAVPLEVAPGLAHPRPDQRQVLDRPDERVPLEELPLLPQQPVELGAVVRAEPAPEDEVLRRRHRRDRVDLEEAEPADRVEHVVAEPSSSCARTAMRRASARLTSVSFTAFVLSHLPPPPRRVLEVGCGAASWPSRWPGPATTWSRSIPRPRKEPIFRQTTIEELDEPGPFDAVVASFSLHHVHDLDAVLDQLRGLLAPEGVLILDEFGWDLLDEPDGQAVRPRPRPSGASGARRSPRLRAARAAPSTRAFRSSTSARGRTSRAISAPTRTRSTS